MRDIAQAVDSGQLTAFVQKLIKTPSLSREEAGVADLVEARMRELDYDQVHRDALHNVVGVIRGSGGGASLMFNGHIDHAGVGSMERPFSGEVIDGAPYGSPGPAIYGRGATDMKAAVACMVEAGGVVKALGLPLRGDVVVTCVAREEMARGEGIKAVLDQGFSADFAVSGEATNLNVYLGHRGKAELAVTTLGKTTHGGNPAGGVNAILKMTKFLRALEQDYPMPGHDFLGDATWTVLDIEASPGALTPIVPDRCRAVLDRRFLPRESRERIVASFQSVLDGLSAQDPEFRAELELMKWFPAMYTPPESPVVGAMLRAREQVLGSPGQMGAWYFGVDGTFINQAGIPCVGFGPGDEHRAHTPQDLVPVDQLAPACQVYAQIIAELCS
ncbi:MAG: M20/M25/M40 family metallo-hydrolase [Desulfarculaceae bacterium]|nr:M20/M25/M40 family metallo-hydrolase [Desulfarculaceae bacterium]MCF8074282.1 M20/M25/M40 family metallo-hydrolase [Desulfarculaceae bacterium]MCF8103350.1 M20/M25/M40 family metallo-hydrolase [Desulfarculaceae bacterium]MCF8117860.1 M20/M25/M40 family metallo-hydrolase [Desulfarculaceae bacterium]